MTDFASEPRVLIRWQLGRELAALRKATSLRQDDVSLKLDWNPAKISRIENGDLGIQTIDLRALLDLYGTVDSDDRSRLEAMARVSRSRHRRTGDEHLLRGRYLTYEDAATSITSWEPYVVPGLLQTERYLRARIMAMHPKAEDNEVEKRVQLRLTRQRRLLSDTAPDFAAVLDESVLRHNIGGRDAMGHQLEHLLDVNRKRNITVQVLPANQAAHPLMGGSATHLTFKGHALELVFFEGVVTDYYETDPEAVRRYQADLTTVRALALDPTNSAKRIKEALAELT